MFMKTALENHNLWTCRLFSLSSMVKVRGQSSNSNTVKQTAENGQNISGDGDAAGVTLLVSGIMNSRLRNGLEFDKLYRKVVYKSRGLYALFQLFGASSIQVRLLFKGGLYAKSWVCKSRKSGLAHVKWKWNLTLWLFHNYFKCKQTLGMRKAVRFSPTSTTQGRFFSSCGFYRSAANVQFEFGGSAASIRVQLLIKCGFYTRRYGIQPAVIGLLWQVAYELIPADHEHFTLLTWPCMMARWHHWCNKHSLVPFFFAFFFRDFVGLEPSGT